MVTDEQVKLLRQERMKERNQKSAAAIAGMSERTARNWEKGRLPSQRKKKRDWRTRKDPFEDVWEEKVVPLLTKDEERKLQARTIMKELNRQDKDKYPMKLLRTLQRRVRDWRAMHGPDQEVMFPQEHRPGREGVFDFTYCKELGVTIAGQIFIHLLFVFKLSFSKWTWTNLAYSETFEAMLSGLQGAYGELGGVTETIRHDNLSAATHELKKSGGRSLNKRFKDVLEHYNLSSTRINPGHSHENGTAEKGNDLVKQSLTQALILRGSTDFGSIDEYQEFVDKVVQRDINDGVQERLELERAQLSPLPSAPLPNYTEYNPKVRKWSTIRVGSRNYSVPSKLIGHEVEVHQYADELEVYYKDKLVEMLPRLRGDEEVRIDYRHIIWSLVRKPGAFARYKWREELFPTLVFRRAYDALCEWRGQRADIEYLRILHLAAATMESLVEAALELLLESGERFDYVTVKELAQPESRPVPVVRIKKPDLSAYDALLGGGR